MVIVGIILLFLVMSKQHEGEERAAGQKLKHEATEAPDINTSPETLP
jgi:hypothetical protein